MPKFKISHAASFLYDIGVKFHASGILREKESGAALFDFYKTNFVSDEQRAKIENACPGVELRGAYAGYAPELRGVYICFPKAEQKRRAKTEKENQNA